MFSGAFGRDREADVFFLLFFLFLFKTYTLIGFG